ncbi:non-ribosomal peptide synthetase, partial [Pilimelia anulata]|uniref:non-ribosomal peptide synthetase n=1 Tax=Pilimelia anulata TaxID=53371 RepID=UPI001667A60D
LHQPTLTATRFTANPHTPGTRMYRTGDLARWDTNGNLTFHGRTDHQVKIRGYRIELPEIETTLTNHPHIRQAAAIVREDQPDNKQLVAYLIPQPHTTINTTDLRHHLTTHLPDYMIPTTLITLDQLPLTPNGKLDHHALPKPDHTNHQPTQPRTPRQHVLCQLFAAVLGLPHIGTNDNFFDHGGHSLLATRLINRIRTT